MGANVFANGREVSAEKSDDQSVGAMPDVCLSPPSPPAGPIPIPYPNFSKASDMTDGTKTVKIAGGQAGMKDQSNYKTSKGDEAATRNFGMGVVSHSIQGTTFFSAWSSDVMFEGANAVRFMDMTTHNHGSQANPPSATLSTGKPKPGLPRKITCKKLAERNEQARNDLLANTDDKSIIGSDREGKGTTVSSAQSISKSGKSNVVSAHSNGKVDEKMPGEFEMGGDPKDRAKGKSGLCKGAGHSHPSPAMQKSGHTEARIFDGMGPTIGGSVRMSIDWRPKSGGEPSKMPCPDCHKILCGAATKPPKGCGIKIELCDSEGKAQQFNKDGEHCPATPSTYQALKVTMGEE